MPEPKYREGDTLIDVDSVIKMVIDGYNDHSYYLTYIGVGGKNTLPFEYVEGLYKLDIKSTRNKKLKKLLDEV